MIVRAHPTHTGNGQGSEFLVSVARHSVSKMMRELLTKVTVQVIHILSQLYVVVGSDRGVAHIMLHAALMANPEHWHL